MRLTPSEQRWLDWYRALPDVWRRAVNDYLNTGDLRPYLLLRERLLHEQTQGLEFPLPERLKKPPLIRRK